MTKSQGVSYNRSIDSPILYPTIDSCLITGLKSVSWEYSCDEEFFKESNKRKFLKYSLLLAVLSRNRHDPISVYICLSRGCIKKSETTLILNISSLCSPKFSMFHYNHITLNFRLLSVSPSLTPVLIGLEDYERQFCKAPIKSRRVLQIQIGVQHN